MSLKKQRDTGRQPQDWNYSDQWNRKSASRVVAKTVIEL